MMKLTADTTNQANDSYGFSYHNAGCSRATTETLRALLEYPVPSSQKIVQDSSSVLFPPLPLSFEAPFDPLLEPLPLKPQVPFVSKPSQILEMARNIHFNMDINAMDPNPINVFNSNNTSSSAGYQESPFDANQQHQHLQSNEESVARFRPFQDEKWKTSFERLLEYKHKYGHCCVPHSYKEDPALARWVKRQRHQYKKYHDNDPTSTLTASRLEQLEAIGFVWHSHAAAWMEKLNELKAFYEQKGHCNVPSTFPENVALSTWVKSQRRQYKLYVTGSPSTMTPLRFKVLKSMGFVFEPRMSASKNAGLELPL